MRRVLIAIVVVAVVAAAILGYFLSGGDEQAVSPVAEADPTQADVQASAPPQPPTQDASSTAEPPTATPGSEAAPAEQAAERPVIMVKPRAPAATAAETQAATAALPKAATAQPNAAQQPAAEAPSFDVVRVERSGETVIAGRAEPDSEVNVTTQGGESIGRARADSTGSWAIVTETPLAPGGHEIGVESADAAGQTRLSEEVVVVVVPESAAVKPSEAMKSPDTSAPQTEVLALLTPREGSAATKVLPQDPEDGIAQGDLVLDSVDYDETGRITVGGRASPGTRMLIYLNNELVGDTVAGPDGRWSHAPAEPVAEGLHSLRVDQVAGDGRVIARVETPFSREAVRVAEADEEFVIVQPGNSLWRIARRSYGAGLRYTVIYRANEDQIRDPDLIYPGQVFEVPKLN
ncbi:MAG: Ig-like domain-containing protein [Kiloniellaceae bacterium]